jgi:hypothetical protein
MINLEFEYILDAERLGSNSCEYNEKLWFWNTTISGWKNNIIEQKVKWDDDSHFLSHGMVSIPLTLKSNNSIAFDDSIGITLISQSPNHDGVSVDVQSGKSIIFINSILSSIGMTNGVFNEKYKIKLKTLNKNFYKSTISLRLLNGKSILKAGIRVNPANEFCVNNPIRLKYDKDNSIEMLGLLTDIETRRELTCFLPEDDNIPQKEKEQRLCTFKGLTDDSLKLHDPVWSNEFDVPAIFFWVEFKKREIQEEVLVNLTKTALERLQVSEEMFIQIIDNQFNSNVIMDEFMIIPRILSEVFSMISTSLRYKSDETYVSKRRQYLDDDEEEGEEQNQEEEGESDNTNNLEKKIMVELFSDAYTYLSGDCEDLAHLSYDIYRRIRNGNEKLKDESKPYKQYGGWNSLLLDRLQHVTFLYINVGQLGIVTSRWLSENEENVNINSNNPEIEHIIIDSEKDKNVEVGGHMYNIAMSIPDFETFYNRSLKSGETPFKYPRSYPKWAQSLPILVIEGTGLLDPYLKPESSYYQNEENRKKFLNLMKRKINVYTNIAKRTFRLKSSSLRLMQMQTKEELNCRLSKFYRQCISCTTDVLLQENYDIAKWFWVTDLKLKKKYFIDNNMEFKNKLCGSNDSGIRLGVNLYDIVYKMPYISLIAVPSMSMNEILAAKSKLKHFMPRRDILIPSSDEVSRAKQLLEQRLSNFKNKLSTISKRREEVMDKTDKFQEDIFAEETYLDFIFRGEEIFDEETQKEIYADLIRFKEIYDVKIYIEILTKEIYNVRLRMYCKSVDKPYPLFDYEKERMKRSRNMRSDKSISSSSKQQRTISLNTISHGVIEVPDNSERIELHDTHKSIYQEYVPKFYNEQGKKIRNKIFINSDSIIEQEFYNSSNEPQIRHFLNVPKSKLDYTLIQWKHKTQNDIQMTKRYDFSNEKIKMEFLNTMYSYSHGNLKKVNKENFFQTQDKGSKLAIKELLINKNYTPIIHLSPNDKDKYEINNIHDNTFIHYKTNLNDFIEANTTFLPSYNSNRNDIPRYKFPESYHRETIPNKPEEVVVDDGLFNNNKSIDIPYISITGIKFTERFVDGRIEQLKEKIPNVDHVKFKSEYLSLMNRATECYNEMIENINSDVKILWQLFDSLKVSKQDKNKIYRLLTFMNGINGSIDLTPGDRESQGYLSYQARLVENDIIKILLPYLKNEFGNEVVSEVYNDEGDVHDEIKIEEFAETAAIMIETMFNEIPVKTLDAMIDKFEKSRRDSNHSNHKDNKKKVDPKLSKFFKDIGISIDGKNRRFAFDDDNDIFNADTESESEASDFEDQQNYRRKYKDNLKKTKAEIGRYQSLSSYAAVDKDSQIITTVENVIYNAEIYENAEQKRGTTIFIRKFFNRLFSKGNIAFAFFIFVLTTIYYFIFADGSLVSNASKQGNMSSSVNSETNNIKVASQITEVQNALFSNKRFSDEVKTAGDLQSFSIKLESDIDSLKKNIETKLKLVENQKDITETKVNLFLKSNENTLNTLNALKREAEIRQANMKKIVEQLEVETAKKVLTLIEYDELQSMEGTLFRGLLQDVVGNYETPNPKAEKIFKDSTQRLIQEAIKKKTTEELSSDLSYMISISNNGMESNDPNENPSFWYKIFGKEEKKNISDTIDKLIENDSDLQDIFQKSTYPQQLDKMIELKELPPQRDIKTLKNIFSNIYVSAAQGELVQRQLKEGQIDNIFIEELRQYDKVFDRLKYGYDKFSEAKESTEGILKKFNEFKNGIIEDIKVQFMNTQTYEYAKRVKKIASSSGYLIKGTDWLSRIGIGFFARRKVFYEQLFIKKENNVNWLFSFSGVFWTIIDSIPILPDKIKQLIWFICGGDILPYFDSIKNGTQSILKPIIEAYGMLNNPETKTLPLIIQTFEELFCSPTSLLKWSYLHSITLYGNIFTSIYRFAANSFVKQINNYYLSRYWDAFNVQRKSSLRSFSAIKDMSLTLSGLGANILLKGTLEMFDRVSFIWSKASFVVSTISCIGIAVSVCNHIYTKAFSVIPFIEVPLASTSVQENVMLDNFNDAWVVAGALAFTMYSGYIFTNYAVSWALGKDRLEDKWPFIYKLENGLKRFAVYHLSKLFFNAYYHRLEDSNNAFVKQHQKIYNLVTQLREKRALLLTAKNNPNATMTVGQVVSLFANSGYITNTNNNNNNNNNVVKYEDDDDPENKLLLNDDGIREIVEKSLNLSVNDKRYLALLVSMKSSEQTYETAKRCFKALFATSVFSMIVKDSIDAVLEPVFDDSQYLEQLNSNSMLSSNTDMKLSTEGTYNLRREDAKQFLTDINPWILDDIKERGVVCKALFEEIQSQTGYDLALKALNEIPEFRTQMENLVVQQNDLIPDLKQVLKDFISERRGT